MPRPTIRIFLMTTAGVLFAGGVAAAATGNNVFSPLLDVATGSGPTTTVVVETTTNETSAIEVDASDGLSEAELAIICAEASNHGEAVSAVAHDKTKVGAEHGAAVSAMAQSNCGKDDDEDSEETESDEQDVDAIEVDASDGLSDAELAVICAEASNHGEAVSAVAHDKTKVGAEHGAAVSAMAQSDCGKDGDDDESQSNRGQSKKNKNGNELGS